MRWPVGSLLTVILMCQIIHVDYVGGERLTIEIDSGREDCFYLRANEGQSLTVEYSVLAVTHGPLNINFQLIDPNGRPLLTEFRKSRSSHKVRLHAPGIYSACFDNTFATFSMKHVSFTLALDVNQNQPTWHKYSGASLEPEGEYGMQVKDIEASIDRVRIALNNIKHLQDLVREMETRDRSLAESNFERVNYWSVINCSVMLFVGAVQVVMVKSLFDQKYSILTTVKKIQRALS